MKNVLVLMVNPAHPALDSGTVEAVVQILRGYGCAVGAPDWLADGVACDIPFDGAAGEIGMTGIDTVTVRAEGRRKKLLVADME